MLHPTSQSRIVEVNTLPAGTFVRAIGNHGSAPLLGVVVRFGEEARPGFFVLEGQNAYSIARADIRGYVCSDGTNLSIGIPDPETTTNDRYKAGQLALTENGPFIIGEFGPEWQRNRVYVDLNTWNAELGLGDFADPTCFDTWSIVSTDGFGNKQTIFSGQSVAG